MKSQTLSQFQSVMQELDTFGRGKDRAKRKARARSTNAYTGGDTFKGKKAMRAPGIPSKTEVGIGQKIKTRAGNVSKSIKNTGKAIGADIADTITRGKAAYNSNAIGAAAGRSQNAAIKSTGSIANKARQTGAAVRNMLQTKSGKVGAGLAAGGLLAAGAATLLKNKKKKNK